MSTGNINKLCDLWGRLLGTTGTWPPFSDHKELFATINATPLGDVPWDSFKLKYNGKCLSQPRDPAEPRAPVEALPQTPRPFVTPLPCYCLHRSSERSALPFIVTMFPFVFGYYFLPFRYVTPCLCSYYS